MGFYISKLGKRIELETIHSCDNYISDYKINSDVPYQYGTAIDNNIYYNKYDDNFLMSNDEYSVIVNFCPFCGINLRRLNNGKM